MTKNVPAAMVLLEVARIINRMPPPPLTLDQEKQLVIELTGGVEKLELVIELMDDGPEQREELTRMAERWRTRIAIAKERITLAGW